MSVSSEVQRTLVKSPPELWAELSNPEALARHLGELGDVRIVRVDPETAVEWEATRASGRVLIEPSGWGTKVTLTVTQHAPPPDQPAPERPAEAALDAAAQPQPEPEATAEPEPEPEAAAELEPEPEQAAAEPEPEPEPDPVAEHEPEPEAEFQAPAVFEEPAILASAPPEQAPAPESRGGFFARLFRGRRDLEPIEREPAAEPAVATPIDPPPAPEPLEEELPALDVELPEPAAFAEPDRDVELCEPAEESPEPAPQPAFRAVEEPVASLAPDMSAELKAAEEVAAEEVRAVLTSVLDRLGAAHHRPFSRS